jgi:DNA polymerase-3 subunit gamma/tau
MNKNNKVLALKYRPQTFKNLIGQKIITETIINSIKINKTPNAYLFTGIRGVGKTTIARIVAKSLNCLNGVDNLCDGDWCANCESISNSNHIDVLEMDAASKTGVDDVRDLIEFSRYGPSSSKYKIFIIDEVHMLSKQAFNALLKTLEEPPEYLKFIFATTDIKKIPITVISRCQRFDLARVKSSELFNFIKSVKEKENGLVTDEALKLIVKISEGSVRDALSLLDRGLLTESDGGEFDFKKAQKVFGYFDKSQLISLFKLIFEGKESSVLEKYREIYDQGIEPKVFINDFLELLYYFKNINYLKYDNNNFSLNDKEFEEIKYLSNKVDNETLITFWQFTVRSLNEIDIVSNQNLSIEMFLIRLIYLVGVKNKNTHLVKDKEELKLSTQKDENKNQIKDSQNDQNTISQIKNVAQQKEISSKIIDKDNKILEQDAKINSFNDLINLCSKNREIQLKYELENNVNLVKFENERLEISFNEKLDKNFVKDLSAKLLDWTNKRWIITLSKIEGNRSYKDQKKIKQKDDINSIRNSKFFNDLKKEFSDIQLVEIKEKNEENND